MKIAVISSRYPTYDNHYAHTFVHTRVRQLISEGYDVEVLIPSSKSISYIIDGVSVYMAPAYLLAEKLVSYDICYVHLLNIYLDPRFNGMFIYNSMIKNNIPCMFYLHGSEVQNYTSRMFDFKLNCRECARFIFKDLYFMPIMRRVVNRLNEKKLISFMAPSNWMVSEAEKYLKITIDDFSIVPNGIDIDRFYSEFRNPSIRKKIITVRPLNSNKYAVDIAIKCMKYLDDFTLDVYGKGPKLQSYVKLARKLGVSERVNFINEFIPNEKMGDKFREYGIALMPTRMDAQGVSMCEALATGILVASSNNTAIPEFINDSINGVLGSSPAEIANKLKKVINDEDYIRITKNAHTSMRDIELKKMMKEELNVIRNFLDK